MIETIQQAVKPHDRYQIEIKLDYALRDTKYTHYKIRTYFFVPKSLGINAQNYDKTLFYHDLQNYIRLKTPNFILRDFTENSTSPLQAIERLVAAENWSRSARTNEQLIHNFKFLSAMFKSAIRDHFNLIGQRIDEAAPDSKLHLIIQNLIEEFLLESQKIASTFRDFYPIFNLPNVNPDVFLAYTLTDESISLLLEESTIEMFQVVDNNFSKNRRNYFSQQLNDLVAAETKHRRGHGYPSILKIDGDNEEYAFRTSVLKKYAASILYLTTAVHREGAGLEQFLFALAAGVSMIFATLMAFYFQPRFGNFSIAFFITLVIGYMFKDRIKELSRITLAQYLRNKLYDRRIIIRTQDGKHKLGVLKEKVAFISDKEVPARVHRLRNRDPLTELDSDGQGERIIVYTKEVVLYTNTFKKIFADMPDITGINDIIRYDIRAYLNKMADPIQERFYLQDEHLIALACHKVYQINIVSKYTSDDDPKSLYKRIRLILNRNGIKRVEHIRV